jgi:hypothetical protein
VLIADLAKVAGDRRTLLMAASRWMEVAGGPFGGISAIGGTPVVRLAHLVGEGCAEVWVKMEAPILPARTRTGWRWR